MADKYIEINTQTLNNDAGGMISDVQKIRKELKNMFDSIIELDSMWEGPANSEFNRQFMADYATLTEICDFMDKFIGCMDFAGCEYVKCENAVGAAVAAIKI